MDKQFYKDIDRLHEAVSKLPKKKAETHWYVYPASFEDGWVTARTTANYRGATTSTFTYYQDANVSYT